MTVEQSLFMAGFLVITAAIVGFIVLVYRRALVLDGGERPRVANLWGLGSLPTERTEGNRWATYLHRVTGVAIVLFLLLHLVDVSLFVWSVPIYDSVHSLYGTTIMRIFECGLLFALCFHAFNGLRLIAIDVWDIGMRGALQLLRVTVVATVALTIAGSIVILMPVLS